MGEPKIKNLIFMTIPENSNRLIALETGEIDIALSLIHIFSYFKESIGLEEDTLDKVIHSPFDYDKQMKVYIPCLLYTSSIMRIYLVEKFYEC